MLLLSLYSCNKYKDEAVIISIKKTHFRYKYLVKTNQWDFYTNEIYMVGDTLKISKIK